MAALRTILSRILRFPSLQPQGQALLLSGGHYRRHQVISRHALLIDPGEPMDAVPYGHAVGGGQVGTVHYGGKPRISLGLHAHVHVHAAYIAGPPCAAQVHDGCYVRLEGPHGKAQPENARFGKWKSAHQAVGCWGLRTSISAGCRAEVLSASYQATVALTPSSKE